MLHTPKRLIYRIGQIVHFFRSGDAVVPPKTVPAKRRKKLTRHQKNHKKKWKTKKQIQVRLRRTGHNIHHRLPKHFGGRGDHWNLEWVNIVEHRSWHRLFYLAWPPRERLVYPINAKWLDIKYLVIDIKTRLFFRAVRHIYQGRRRFGDPNNMSREYLLESHRLLEEMLRMRGQNPYEYFDSLGVKKSHLLQRAVKEDQVFFKNEFDGHRRRNGNGNGKECHEHE